MEETEERESFSKRDEDKIKFNVEDEGRGDERGIVNEEKE